MLKSFDFDSSTDRSKGIVATTDGAWFQVVGDIPVTLKASLNEQSGMQFSIVPYQVYPVAFRQIYLFHAAGLASRTFTIVSGGYADKPTPFVPQLVRAGDFIEVVRSPTVWKSANLTASGHVWIPATGKRARLMGYSWNLTGDAHAAVAGVLNFTMTDNTTNIESCQLWIPAATPAIVLPSAFVRAPTSIGNGYLFARDTPVDFNFNTLVGGTVSVTMWGTEE